MEERERKIDLSLFIKLLKIRSSLDPFGTHMTLRRNLREKMEI